MIPETPSIEEVSAEDSGSMSRQTEKYFINNNYSNEGAQKVDLKQQLPRSKNKAILSNITNLLYSENKTPLLIATDENKYKTCTKEYKTCNNEYEKFSSHKCSKTACDQNSYQIDSPKLILQKQQPEKLSKSIESFQKLARHNYDTNDENFRANKNFKNTKSISEIEVLVSPRFTEKIGSIMNKEFSDGLSQNNARSTSNLLHINRSTSNLALNTNGIKSDYEESRSKPRATIADHHIMEPTEPKKGIGFEKQYDKFYSKKGSITSHTSRRSSIIPEIEGIPALSLKKHDKEEKINSLTEENLKLTNKINELELQNAYLINENYKLKSLDEVHKLETKRSTTELHSGDKSEYIKILKNKNEKNEFQNYELKKINKELEEKLHSSKNDLLSNSKNYEDIIGKLKIELDKTKGNSSNHLFNDDKLPQERFNSQTEDFLSYTLDTKRPIEQNTPEIHSLFKELQSYQRNTQKFIGSITKMVMECSPSADSKPPNLKEIWKWLKHIFQDYMGLKKQIKSAKSLKEKDVLEQIQEFLLVTKKDDIIPAINDILVQNTKFSQLISMFKILLDLTHAQNTEDLEEILEHSIKEKNIKKLKLFSN